MEFNKKNSNIIQREINFKNNYIEITKTKDIIVTDIDPNGMTFYYFDDNMAQEMVELNDSGQYKNGIIGKGPAIIDDNVCYHSII